MPQSQKDPALPKPASLPEGPNWSAGFTNLQGAQAETLCMILRTLFPHDSLGDGVYRRTVRAFDEHASTVATVVKVIEAANAACPMPFKDCAESYRVAALQTLEETEDFRILQPWAVRFFYDDLEVWQAFGYEGASIHLGGYVKRGFNDLYWLPEIPAEETL